MKPAPCTLPLKLRLWATGSRKVRGNKSLSAIAKRWVKPLVESTNPFASTSNSLLLVEARLILKSTSSFREQLSQVLHGRRNTPKLVAILEQEYNLPIATIRALVEEHKTRIRSGNPVTSEEAILWMMRERIRRENPGLSESELDEEARKSREFSRRAAEQVMATAA